MRSIAGFVLLLMGMALASSEAPAQPLVSFDHLVYLTRNPDSLARSFERKGMAVLPGTHQIMGLQSRYVALANDCYLEFQSTRSLDSSDLRNQALSRFGNHVSGLVFRTSSIDSLILLFQRAGIPISDVMEGESRKPDGSTYRWKGIALVGSQPLDVVFVNDARDRSGDSVLPKQHLDWLLFTASRKAEAMLRKLYSVLGFRKSHQGCCDYWQIGPTSERVMVRFELSSHPELNEGIWLSLESGGVLFAD